MAVSRQKRLLIAYIAGLAVFAVCWWLGSAPPQHARAPTKSSGLPPWLRTDEPAEMDGKEWADVSDLAEVEPGQESKEASSLPAQPNRREPWATSNKDDWRLIILFQHNFGILMQAVDSFRRGSNIMVPNMIIVDNSVTKVQGWQLQ